MNPRTRIIVDQAQAEAKRYGCTPVRLGHVVLSLMRYGHDVDAHNEASVRAMLSDGQKDPSEQVLWFDATELLSAAVSQSPDQLHASVLRMLGSEPLDSRPTPMPVNPPASPEVAPIRGESHEPLDSASLLALLRSEVLGQDEALERLVRRLALTRRELDLRPERPDGVFLLLGPTGVGKTHLARVLCRALFGDEARLIRLDMSEYAEPWSQSRLTGSNPGYVGHDDPSGWLTSKVIALPQSVVLLDEIEKAHPSIWQTFLQVLDAGRLTDGKNRTADFRRCVVVMTSNVGARAFEPTSFGFDAGNTTDPDRAQSTVLQDLRRLMPPEFVNRIDEILVFNALPPDTIRTLARQAIDRQIERVREVANFELEVPDEVVKLVADSGYDARYGARHLERSIERHLLAQLANLPTGRYRATLVEDAVCWVDG